MMSPTQSLGTRFEVGNRVGHHGWLVSGYGLPGQSRSMYAENMSMTIRDEGNINYDINNANIDVVFIWDRALGAPNNARPLEITDVFTLVPGLGYLWGYHGYEGDIGIFAPMSILFGYATVNTHSRHQSAELMYTYRAHPFTWGGMELLGGVRYWGFEDDFGFTGTNIAGAVANTSALDYLSIKAQGNNRVFGPQVGIKLSRQNARWTFGAEGRFTGGINAQTVKTTGYLTPNGGDITAAAENSAPIGLIGNGNRNFGHKQNKSYFSPIGELRFSADWQWTNAVSFYGAVDGMFASNIARGVRVTDYAVHSDGTIFGIRGNDRNTTVLVYGVETGIKVRR
jgi:hypothetical protein